MTDPVSKAEALKPCPFCGGKAGVSYDSGVCFGECNDCHTEGPCCRSAAEAIDAWNRRAAPLAPAGRQVTLEECPIGMFRSESGELCLKTEYGGNEGLIDAYIVSTGEFFWGAAPQTITNQRKQLVQPLAALPEAPAVGVRAKPLVWEIAPGYIGMAYRADSLAGPYIAQRNGVYFDSELISTASSITQAKAAAQADFDQRIRSAIVAPPAALDAGSAPEWTREDLAVGLAALDGIVLRRIKSTVGPSDDANNWREYLGRADDLMAHLSAAPGEAP